jgi:hypothetical protein
MSLADRPEANERLLQADTNGKAGAHSMTLKQGDPDLLQSDAARRLLSSRIPARFAYIAPDGTPRGISPAR